MLGTAIREGSTGGAPTSAGPAEPSASEGLAADLVEEVHLCVKDLPQPLPHGEPAVADKSETADDRSPHALLLGQDALGADEAPGEPAEPEPAEPEPEEANDEETGASDILPVHAPELLERLATVEREAAKQRLAHAHLADELAAFQDKAGDIFTSLYRGQELMMRSLNERKSPTPRLVRELTGPELSSRSGVASPAPPMPPPLMLPLPTQPLDIEAFSSPSARLVSVAPPISVAPPPLPVLDARLAQLESELREDLVQLEVSLEAAFRRDVDILRDSLAQRCVEEVAGGCEEILQRCCEEATLRIESCWGGRVGGGLQCVAEELEDESGEVSGIMPQCPQQQAAGELCALQAQGESLSREMLTLRTEIGELRASADKNEKLYARHVARGERDLAGIRGDFQAWSATAGFELDMVRDELNRLHATLARPTQGVLATSTGSPAAESSAKGVLRDLHDSAEVTKEVTSRSVQGLTPRSAVASSAASTPRSARSTRSARSARSSSACTHPVLIRTSAEPRRALPGTGSSNGPSAQECLEPPVSARLARETSGSSPTGGALPGGCGRSDRSLVELAQAVAAAAGARVPFSVSGFGPRAFEGSVPRFPAMCAICVSEDQMDNAEIAVLSSRDPWHEAESEVCVVSSLPVLGSFGTPRSPTGDRIWTL